MGFHRDLKGPALHAPTNERVENNTGSSIQKLKVVSLDGVGTTYPQVILANPNLRKNFGVALGEILNGSDSYVTTVGFMVNVDTSAWPNGTTLYSDVSGNLSTTQLGNPVAIVCKQDVSCGCLYVLTLGDNFGIAGGTPWLLAGNTGTDEDVDFIGTNDVEGFTFKTNGTRRAKFESDGRFALGDLSPEGKFHMKFHSGFDGSGKIQDTAGLSSNDLAYNTIYNYTVPDLSTVILEATLVGHEDGLTNRATFKRTASFYRNGASTTQEGLTQSDYTFKSNSDFNTRMIASGGNILVQVKNANDMINVRWTVHIALTVIKNP